MINNLLSIITNLWVAVIEIIAFGVAMVGGAAVGEKHTFVIREGCNLTSMDYRNLRVRQCTSEISTKNTKLTQWKLEGTSLVAVRVVRDFRGDIAAVRRSKGSAQKESQKAVSSHRTL